MNSAAVEGINRAMEHDERMTNNELAHHLSQDHRLTLTETPYTWASRIGLVSNHSWVHQPGRSYTDTSPRSEEAGS